MRKRTTTPPVGQLSLFDYKPDPFWFLDSIDNNALYGHLLSHQQTEEFRSELAIQFAKELAKRPKAKYEAVKKYRQRHPVLSKRRDRMNFHKPKIRVALREKQNNQCYYCRCELDDRAQIDHRKPMIKGGSDDMDNLALVCAWCNRHKHTMSETGWRKRMTKIVKLDEKSA